MIVNEESLAFRLLKKYEDVTSLRNCDEHFNFSFFIDCFLHFVKMKCENNQQISQSIIGCSPGARHHKILRSLCVTAAQ